MYPAIAIILVFVGCCLNVVCLELLVTECPGAGNIIAFFQFLFVASKGFVFTVDFGRKERSIPLECYIKMTILYSIGVIFQNVLLHLQVDIPLQQLLRSGSLIANLVLGIVLLKKSYRLSKYISVCMISVGIAMATIASANSMTHWPQSLSNSDSQVLNWAGGVLVLLMAFGVSAYMGIYQEIVFNKYGKHSAEALYYNHMLPLPVFVLLSRDIVQHIVVFNQSACITVPLLNVILPKFWFYLIINVLTHYVCIACVFVLTAECSSLTVNLVVTLRKFLSLLFSVVYFNNSFTLFHWTGTIFVFTGTFLFLEIFKSWTPPGDTKRSIRTCNGSLANVDTINSVLESPSPVDSSLITLDQSVQGLDSLDPLADCLVQTEDNLLCVMNGSVQGTDTSQHIIDNAVQMSEGLVRHRFHMDNLVRTEDVGVRNGDLCDLTVDSLDGVVDRTVHVQQKDKSS